MPVTPVRVVGLLAALIVTMTPTSARGAEVVSDDTADNYLITGALLFDDRYPEARDAAGCTDCHWQVTRICSWEDIGARPGCILQAWPCTADEQLAEVLRADASTRPTTDDPRWQYRGAVCLGASPPTPALAIHREVHEQVRLAVPPLRAASQPTGTTLTRLRTYFRTGQPVVFQPGVRVVAGVPVTVRARPSWRWDFTDGPPLSTTNPGGSYPDGAVHHTFRRRGLYRITVVTTWHATFDARGITDIPVTGAAVTQTQSFDLRVREGRAFLNKESR